MKLKLYFLQRGTLFFFFLLILQSFSFSQQVAKTIPNATSPDKLIGFLEFKPADYGSQKHPLIIFLHGIGERGNGTSQINSVANNGTPYYCAHGATMRFTVGGQTSSFVVLSPQLSTQYGYWPTFYVKEMIKYAKANLQIDPNRIYITGLSLGGGGTWRAITETDTENFDYSFDAGIAAAAPVCGTQEMNDGYFCRTVGDNHLPIWAFHCMDDGTVGVGATQHGEIIAKNCGVTPAAKFTYYQSGGHGGAWINAYDTGHITRTVNGGGSFTANPNMYEWFLSHSRSASQPSYTAPTANAGITQIITLPLNTITLTGSGSGTNGATISSYSWSKTSGPAGGIISLPLLNITLVTGLVQGTYVFTLTVTDNHGLSSSSNVTITVNPLFNQSPLANAGSNASITLPTSNITLNGSASSDPDGTIASYAWTKTSGPSSYNIVNSGAASTAVNNLVQGTYVFTLKVTDNAGASASSTVTITVNAAPAPANQSPVANAGGNTSITLPTSNITLNGSASSDPDGSIASYAWTKTSGPSSYNIVNSGAASTAVNNLVQGTYVFTLKVTDNAGAEASSTVTITVNAAPAPANQLPVANAGGNTSITLPTSNITLNGSASSDPDGTISSYAWTKTSGPSSYNIVNSGAASTAVNNLVQGIYVFTLKVTDNAGAEASSTVTITVNAAPAPANQSPVANAGGNTSITLPTSNITLNGSASSDPDGSIASYAWTKTSGPSSYNIVNSGAASTAVNNLVQGIYVFTLKVTDNAGAEASSTVTITVNAAPAPANQSPVANAGGNTSITLPTSNITLNGSASSDPDGTISSYAWTKTSGPSSYNIVNSGAASTAVNNLVQGTYVFTLKVTDNAGAEASSTVTITVNAAPAPANQLPVANAGGNTSITLPTSNITLNGSASSDPDGTIASYAWTKTSGPSSYNIVNSGAASTAVNNLVQGTYVFTLKVTDNAGAEASSTVTVIVNAAVAQRPPANEPPVANAGSDISITLPADNVSLDGNASSDRDGTISSYAWTKTSGPSSYNIVNSDAASTAVNNLVQGTYVFTLKVRDNAGAEASSTVTVIVNAALAQRPPPNQPPVANAGSDISITLPVNSVSLDGRASSDPDGTISSYAWTKTSGPSSYNIANADAASSSVNNLVQGTYVFTLTITDNAGAEASSAVTVTVNRAPNQIPVANAGSDIDITLPVNATPLDGSGSFDTDGSISTYSWNKLAGPGATTIVNSNTASPTLIGLMEGQYMIELTVTDNEGAISTDQVIVNVHPQPNKTPVADAGKDTAIALPVSSAILSGMNSGDADGAIVAYAWKQISGPSAAVIAQPAQGVTAVDSLIEGDYVFELKVTDNGGLTATATVKLTVLNNFRYSQFFKLYPNPATSSINLQFIDDKTGKLGIAVYDVSGKLVISEEFSKSQSLITKEINIGKLKPGVYYLELRHADGTKLIRPFVKQ